MTTSARNATTRAHSMLLITSCVVAQAPATPVDFGYCRSAPIRKPWYCSSVAIRAALIMTRERNDASKRLLLTTCAAFIFKLANELSCSDSEPMDGYLLPSSRDNLLVRPFCMVELLTSKMADADLGDTCEKDFCWQNPSLAVASPLTCLIFSSGVSPPSAVIGATRFTSTSSLSYEICACDSGEDAPAAVLNSLILSCNLLLSAARAIMSLVWTFCNCSRSSTKV
mmetsp:Transcript_36759/g.101099  ORF Transcript_36759/g.101099 Transcript_36759/m.101099 type:complete len:226 (+) Transcript_36759:1621-2298(+)